MKKVLSDNNRKVNNKIEKAIAFVATFRTRLKIFQKKIDKILYLLYMNEQDRKTFTPNPMIL